ncbi:3456_t:CDS:2, partial [Acaulospora morrowiae]
IVTADFEGSDDEFPSLAFIKSRIDEISKKKTEKWSILRDLQAENSEEPEPELDSESGSKLENGPSNSISEKSSPLPKFEPLEISLSSFKDEKEKTNILSSPTISNHERNDFRTFSNHTRNEPTSLFSNHERSEAGPFTNHSRTELNPFPIYFPNHDRYESFLYSNHDRNDLGRFSNHERSDSGRFSNHERSDPGIPSFNRLDDDINAFHHQLPPFSLKRFTDETSSPPGPLYKRPRPMSNGMHYSESMNH